MLSSVTPWAIPVAGKASAARRSTFSTQYVPPRGIHGLMKRLFKTCPFSRWARKARLSDWALRQAAEEMVQGLIDALYGIAIDQLSQDIHEQSLCLGW